MNRQDKQYIKTARNRARDHLRKKSGYKTAQEKKAFRIAERLRIRVWRESLRGMDAAERALQKKAFRAYRGRIYLRLQLIALGVLLVAAAAALIILL